MSKNAIFISERIPGDLRVLGAGDKPRTLLSYKTAIDVFVIVYLMPGCSANESLWPELRRFHQRYRDWHVSFLVVTPVGMDASKVLANLDMPVAMDAAGSVARRLKVSRTPLVLITDEGDSLRYRGPLKMAPQALDAVIGHMDPVKDPEPLWNGGCPTTTTNSRELRVFFARR